MILASFFRSFIKCCTPKPWKSSCRVGGIHFLHNIIFSNSETKKFDLWLHVWSLFEKSFSTFSASILRRLFDQVFCWVSMLFSQNAPGDKRADALVRTHFRISILGCILVPLWFPFAPLWLHWDTVWFEFGYLLDTSGSPLANCSIRFGFFWCHSWPLRFLFDLFDSILQFWFPVSFHYQFCGPKYFLDSFCLRSAEYFAALPLHSDLSPLGWSGIKKEIHI